DEPPHFAHDSLGANVYKSVNPRPHVTARCPMKRRTLALPIAAAVIMGLVAWRLSWEPPLRNGTRRQTTVRRLAPRFELYDQRSQLVKFERYLGRTRLLLLFIADTPAAEHPLVLQLLGQSELMDSANVQVIVVGMATPYANRESERRLGRSLPFPVLTDVNLQTPEPAPTHRLWGLAGDDPADVREGLYLIDRDGAVNWPGAAPQPAADPAQTIEAVARSEWP
ncbi:MAG: hypothetical protein AB7Q45_26005, partial [Planctomycetaceae bacterium]